MAWDGSGNFTRTIDWTDDRDAATKILASRHDTNDNELTTGIGACLTKNNETKPTADFKPNADATYSLGSTALRWINGWMQALKLKTGTTYVATLQSTNLTADRTIEFPDAAGTLSLLPVADTQTLVKGSADATKLLRIEADGITTGTTRVWTAPDKDGTVAMTSDITPLTILDAAGDMSYASAADTVARLAIGTARQRLTVNAGATAPAWADAITLGTPVASTSGTAIDFTSLPAGVKRITINFVGVSTNGTASWLVQLGDSGGVESSGYLGASRDSSSGSNYTAAFGIQVNTASAIMHGRVVLELENSSSNTWTCHGLLSRSDNTEQYHTSGSKSLSATLDRVRVTTGNGTDAFDAGEINITYE